MCADGEQGRGPQPLIENGQVFFARVLVHIEFVYGGLSIMPKRSVGSGRQRLV